MGICKRLIDMLKRLRLFFQRPPEMPYWFYFGFLFAYFVAWGLVGLNYLVALGASLLMLFI